MIDFSKAPEGATHYDDSTKTIGWWKMGPQGWVMNTGYFNGVPVWAGVAGCYALDFKEIPKQTTMLIECKTNRDDVIKVVCALINSEFMFKLVWNECVDDHNFASSEAVDECIDAALVNRAIAIVEEVNSRFNSGDK